MPEAETVHDIETRADCERLVRSFYGRALTDSVIGWLFTDIAKIDLEAHIPRITNFWETILLDAQSYGGGAFRPHLELNFKTPLKRGHFERWLYLWHETVDELFVGEHAELAKSHATRVATAFNARLRSFDQEGVEFAPGIPDELPSRPPRSPFRRGLKIPWTRRHRGTAPITTCSASRVERLPVSLPVRVLRLWLPVVLCLLGAVLLVVNGFDLFGVSAFAAFVGAGSSIWLANFLWRLGVSGDDERDREAEGRGVPGKARTLARSGAVRRPEPLGYPAPRWLRPTRTATATERTRAKRLLQGLAR